MKSVYLAGPILGQTYEGATNWRQYAKEQLAPEIVAYSPMRAKEYLKKTGAAAAATLGDTYEDFPLSTSRAIMQRDYYDCTTCDMLVVNFLGAHQASIGTSMEIAWAYQLHKPIAIAIEKHFNPHDHGMIREAIGFQVDTLEDLIHVTKSILLP